MYVITYIFTFTATGFAYQWCAHPHPRPPHRVQPWVIHSQATQTGATIFSIRFIGIVPRVLNHKQWKQYDHQVACMYVSLYILYLYIICILIYIYINIYVCVFLPTWMVDFCGKLYSRFIYHTWILSDINLVIDSVKYWSVNPGKLVEKSRQAGQGLSVYPIKNGDRQADVRCNLKVMEKHL